MKKLISTFFFIILFISLASALSLPSSTTKETGNVCEIGHSFSYNYNFVYNNSLTIGTYSNFDVSFLFSGDRKLLQNPYTIDVVLTPTGAELTSTSFSLNQGFKSIQIKPLTNNPTINVKTILTLNGISFIISNVA